VTENELAAIRNEMFQRAVNRLMGEGVSRVDAEARVNAALDAPSAFPLQTFEELEDFSDIEYDDMTDEQKRIVDEGNIIAHQAPQGLSREEMSAWLDATFPTSEAELERQRAVLREVIEKNDELFGRLADE
jgi:hypothetical protein